jgi:uncharacterized protein YbaR (Trm112 family)
MNGESQPAPTAQLPTAISTLDRRLLEILVCPLTKSALEFDPVGQELISRQAGLAFPIRHGVPIMLADEARAIEKR